MNAQLVVTNGPSEGTTVNLFTKHDFLIGRHPDCNLALQDTRISSQHCRIFHQDDQYFIEDLNSTNGTAINHHPITAIQMLHDNDLIFMGDICIRFQKEAREEKPKKERNPQNKVGDYYLLKKIGEGASGEIYQAENIHSGEIVALKIFHAYRLEEVAIQRFLREAKICMKFNHPRIVKVFEFAMFCDRPVIVMEYLNGISLLSYIKKNGAMPVKIVLKIGAQIAQGLYYVHKQGVIHRDLNPANIFLMPHNQLKIIDFGIMKISGERITMPCQVLGSLNYIPPEQIDNASNIDVRADIYSLGATLYHALLGRPPYFDVPGIHALTLQITSKSVQPLDELMDIPKSTSDLISKAMAFDRLNRFSSAEEVFYSIQNELANFKKES
ncbi:MAG: protein kinase [Planctomycetes bacterium]|nr:protein kinase [Planctomycetota bacterium]HNZ66028.1 FHA domain-containing serine/threonine-protein kinase [Planctomycetota bacterium]HON43852.1 FHA domain-containing serine/threonine-protein kinase [Planctomycetota bacterium]HPY75934.1 FHA domain-containing serine/threonine-protein kinase [Planctomycetota bacterium]HQB01479.1 FHA domain-containing serine/threonine-protein kinase [Planctomycetota bacterium]